MSVGKTKEGQGGEEQRKSVGEVDSEIMEYRNYIKIIEKYILRKKWLPLRIIA